MTEQRLNLKQSVLFILLCQLDLEPDTDMLSHRALHAK